MKLYFLQKLFFRDNTFLNTTNLVSNNIIGYRPYNNIVIMHLFACTILSVFQYELRPFKRVLLKNQYIESP